VYDLIQKGYATVVVEDCNHLGPMMKICDLKNVHLERGELTTVSRPFNRRRPRAKTTRAVHFYSGETVKLHVQNLRTDFDIKTVAALVWSMFVPLGAEEVTITDRENKYKRRGGKEVYRSANIRLLKSRFHDPNFLKSLFYFRQSIFQEWLGVPGSVVVLDLKRD